MADAKIRIGKLNHENYSEWEFNMKLLLEREKVWDFLQQVKPEANVELGESLKKWNKNNTNAKYLTGLHLESNQQVYVKNVESAAEWWELLRNNHLKPTLGGRMNKLLSTKFEKGDNMNNFVSKMLGYNDTLRQINSPLTEELAIGVILSSVNKEFSNVVTAMEA